MEIDFEEDITDITNEQLSEITELAGKQIKLEAEVEALEQKLAERSKELREIREGRLPEAMAAVGLASFRLATGETIAVSEKLYASIPKKSMSRAITWLMEHGQSALVQTDVVVPFDRGDAAKRDKVLDLLTAQGYSAFSEDRVNTSSVKSVIKELLEQGRNVPLSLFGAYFHRKAVIKK